MSLSQIRSKYFITVRCIDTFLLCDPKSIFLLCPVFPRDPGKRTMAAGRRPEGAAPPCELRLTGDAGRSESSATGAQGTYRSYLLIGQYPTRRKCSDYCFLHPGLDITDICWRQMMRNVLEQKNNQSNKQPGK